MNNKEIYKGKTLAAIVPVYNTENYLIECVESLVRQIIPFDEILLINDGSTDGSLSLCKKFQNLYSNIKVYSHDNRGVSYTRNYGIDRCKSDYILFIDSDDMLEPDAVKLIKEKLIQKEYDMVLYDAKIKCEEGFARNGKYYDKSEYISQYYMSGKEFLDKMFPECYSTVIYLSAYNKLYLSKRKLKFEVGISYAEDTPFIMEALLGAKEICYIPLKLYVRRIRENSVTTSPINEKKVKDSIFIAEKISQIICSSIWQYIDYADKLIALGLFHFDVSISNQKQIKDDINLCSILNEEKKNFIRSFLLFLKNTRIIWENGDNISNVQKALKIVSSYERLWSIEIDMEITNMKTTLQKVILYQKIKKMKKLPLKDKNCIVAFYGTGNTAFSILSLFKKLIGNIECQIIFIETNKNYNEKEGYPVFEIDKIPLEIDFIVISSFKYRREMNNQLISKKINIEVIDIFENENYEVEWTD